MTPFKKKQSLLRSFACALRGICHGLWHERNLRIHFTAAGYVFYLSRYYALSREARALLVLCVGCVFCAELLNTGLEYALDADSLAFSDYARNAKDVAAGAVLAASVASACVGAVLLWDPPILLQIARDIWAKPWGWVGGAALSLAWIWLPSRRQRAKNDKKLHDLDKRNI